jgi:CheY-like chemotaxis protein
VKEKEARPNDGRLNQQAEHTSGDGRSTDGAGCLTVLIVDDNVDAALTLSDLVQLWGYSVQTAYGALEALEIAGRERPHVVLLDIGLPRMDGYEVARRLRADPGLEGALLVAVTGYSQADDRARSLAAGFDHHLIKPVSLDELQGLLEGRRREGRDG